jgi:hypothetical protein
MGGRGGEGVKLLAAAARVLESRFDPNFVSGPAHTVDFDEGGLQQGGLL